MSTLQDSLTLLGVGLLNIFAAIILAGLRARSENPQSRSRLPEDMEAAQG